MSGFPIRGLEQLTDPEVVEAWRRASPWPHVVLDGVVSSEFAQAASAEVHALPEGEFTWQRTRRIQKGSLSDRARMGPATLAIVDALADASTIDLLRHFSGIEDLEGDPGLAFAGLYLTPPGGWQRVHQDFTRHPFTRAHNRLAVLLYLSEWSPGDGGELELWDRSMRGEPRLIEPVPGRLVVFEPDSTTMHGVRVVRSDRPARVAVGMRFYSSVPPPNPPLPLYRQTVRRPGESLFAVLPSLREVGAMAVRLHSIRRTAKAARSGQD